MSDTSARISTPATSNVGATISRPISSLHNPINVETYISLQLLATIFPLTAGFMAFGWRALATTAIVVFSAIAGVLVWRRIGCRGGQMRISHCAHLATLVALMLPAHLLTGTPITDEIVWPLLPAAGLTLALAAWLLGGLGSQRLHSSVVTIVVIFAIFHSILTPRYVLRRDRIFIGDLMKVNPDAPILSGNAGWIQSPGQASAGYDSLRREPPGDTLLAYTSAQVRPDRASITVQMLIRDQLPPLEDLIFAGQSGPIGTASGVAVIVGGLFLLYQGVIDFRIPLFSLLTAMATILIAPIPLVITDTTVNWHWLTFRPHMLGPAAGVTFMNYEIFSSPFLLTILFLASTPGLRPLTRRGRIIFAVILGVAAALLQLYVSNAIGPYIALLIASLLSPVLDRILMSRTLV